MNDPGRTQCFAAREPLPVSTRELAFLVLLILAGVGLWVGESVPWETWVRGWREFADWAGGRVRLVTEDSPIEWVLCPTALMIAWAGSLVLLYDRPPDRLRLPVAMVFLAFQSAYLAFRLVGTLCLDSPANALLSILFFCSEAFVHLRIAAGNFMLLRLTDRSAAADASVQAIRAGAYAPAVDVFVPTYSESVEMLRRTIIGCQAMEYPNFTVHLLDDQRRPAMRELATELGCRYLDRPDNRHAKAGNLNHALAVTHGELIVCFDADFVPTRDFLLRTVGLFREPDVAMVQTPQNFFNEDCVMRNFGLGRQLEDEQRFFFRALQPARDATNSIVCHGSCFVVRRTALEGVGGVPTETITEDWATSIRLQAAGWRLLYLNEALSAGMSADRCGEFVQQRSRWAQGTLQAIFASTNPLTIRGLNWKQRLMHASSILYYLGSISSFIHLIAPLFYLFFGLTILRMSLLEMLFFRLPLMVGYWLLFSWLTCRTRSALWTEFYDAFLAPSMAVTAARSLCKPFGAGFRVTDKTVQRRGLTFNRRVALPFAVLLVLHLAGMAVAIATGRQFEDQNAFTIATWFTIGNVSVLWLCLLASIDVGQAHRFHRFKHRLAGVVLWEDTGLRVETVSLSEGDTVVRWDEGAAPPPARAYLHLPSIGWEDVAVTVKRGASKSELLLEFRDLTLAQRRTLIEHLYCRPGQWERQPKSEVRGMWEYIVAGLRLHSLAESR